MPRERSLGSAAMRADTTILLALPTISHTLSPSPTLARSRALSLSLSASGALPPSLPSLSLGRGVQFCGVFFSFSFFFLGFGGGGRQAFLRQYFGYFSKISSFFVATHNQGFFFFFFPSIFLLYQKFGEKLFCLPQISPNKSNLHLQRKKQFLNFP